MEPYELLRDKREDMNMNQEQLAKELGIGQSYLSKLERGIQAITAKVIRKYTVVMPLTDDDILFLLGFREVE